MPATIGAPAPEFTLKDQDPERSKAQRLSRQEARGPRLLSRSTGARSAPKSTPAWSTTKNNSKQLDAQVLGVSVDSVWSHKAYAEKMGIHYPLLADFQPRGAVAAKYGVYLEDKGITGRAISIIDRDGNLAWHKNYDIPVVPDINEVSKALAAVK